MSSYLAIQKWNSTKLDILTQNILQTLDFPLRAFRPPETCQIFYRRKASALAGLFIAAPSAPAADCPSRTVQTTDLP